MRLKKIIANLDIIKISNFKDYNIKTITHYSKDVVDSSIFICLTGNNCDGIDFVEEAIIKGAKCIITDVSFEDDRICVILVKDSRIAMSIVAKNFYNRCCDTMKIIGVVGTSGKTSTSIIIGNLLSINDKKIGIIGTNGVYIGGIRLDNKFTTPDPLELHYIFYQMKMLGVDIVVMEVSAQAIYYKKVYGIMFDIGVFTNISEEHLDFFESFEKYVKVKMDFFCSKNMKECIVNVDDFYGRELAYKVDIPCVSYGINSPSNSFAIDMKFGLETTQFVANVLDDIINVSCCYVGMYSVYNILAALTVAKLLGFDKNELQSSTARLTIIDGRFNVYNSGSKKVIIDFAHTPKSIESLMEHIKSHSKSKIISVFGCVGYSNKQKRIDMGNIVAKYSDMIVVTSDNPGKTKFCDICNDIIIGIGNTPYVCIEDRVTAINYAYSIMNSDEILVLIGKGAEDFQKIGDERIAYSDKSVVLSLIKKDNE